jgi:hypothetical protein
LYGYTAAKPSVEIVRFVPVHPTPDEKIAAVFEHAAEPTIASFVNNFARRLRFSPPVTDYGHESKEKFQELGPANRGEQR